MMGEGLAGGMGLYFLSPWAGAGFGMTMLGFGAYIAAEGLINAKPAATPTAKPGTQPAQPATPGAAPSPVNVLPQLGQSSPLPTPQQQAASNNLGQQELTNLEQYGAPAVAQTSALGGDSVANAATGLWDDITGGSTGSDGSTPVSGLDQGSSDASDMSTMGALYQGRMLSRMGALRRNVQLGALYDPRRVGALVHSGF
jgi:hypothetical protein